MICPKCKQELTENSWGWFCDNENCGEIKLFRRICNRELSREEAEAIVAGKKPLIKGLKSKKGREFSARLYIEKGTVRFEFPD